MVKFIQSEHELIGDLKDIQALASKESARVLCVSDSHGSRDIFENIIKNYAKECDALIFCGDGCSDLAAILNSAKKDKKSAECIPPVIAAVRGNNDSGRYPVTDDFSFTAPATQILTAAGKKIFITHGHKQGVYFGLESLGFEAQLSECSIAVYGHTHIASNKYVNGYTFFNPGSIALPRGIHTYSFAILTVTKNVTDVAFLGTQSPHNADAQYKIFTPMV